MATTIKSRKAAKSKRSSPGTTPTPTKQKRSTSPEPDNAILDATEHSFQSVDLTTEKIPIFKDKTFVHSSKGFGGTKRTKAWKSLKQIIATDKTLPWPPDAVPYGSIEAPPSFIPAKKYSDLTGLQAKYTDPQTKLRYATPDEYTQIRMLPSDLVTGLLALRKANIPVP